MKSRWDSQEASRHGDDPLSLRVYTSRLLGQETSLVLHGGGNTSVKATVQDFFGDDQAVLYIKGSGWDLATIAAPGFAPVKLEVLKRLATLETLADTQMVQQQRAAMLDPTAPNPSVEAILHAIIPFRFVDHTHADAVVTLTNNPQGEALLQEVYGDRVLVIPYVMPGFVLARKIFELTQGVDWSAYDGMILMNHGVFSFADDAKTSYENMIALVTQAEDYLAKKNALTLPTAEPTENLMALATLRKQVSQARGQAVIARLYQDPHSVGFASLPNVGEIATRGPITPDHVIRTKRIPMVFDRPPAEAVADYVQAYQSYFDRNTQAGLTMLDPAPRWGVWPGHGVLSFDLTLKAANIIGDIVEHTIAAIQIGEALGGWQALDEASLFEVEYWELEQAKLKKGGTAPLLQGKVALVTGAASGIGLACAQKLHKHGAVVVGLDLNPAVSEILGKPDFQGIPTDVTDAIAVKNAVESIVHQFGGLDIVIANAGIFPGSMRLESMDETEWNRSLAVNLTSQQRLLQTCIPYLKQGIDPTVVLVTSKNVPAPGPGQAAYSVAKAGLTQVGRVAALELGGDGIRVNMIHPDAVFDTSIWTPEVLEARAKHYGITVDAYKTKNLLKTEITSHDVAELVLAMVGPAFAKTTGAQVPIDGGNDRVI